MLEANRFAARDVPDYVEDDHSRQTATCVSVPARSDVPYPVPMEPNLVEFYSRRSQSDRCRFAVLPLEWSFCSVSEVRLDLAPAGRERRPCAAPQLFAPDLLLPVEKFA